MAGSSNTYPASSIWQSWRARIRSWWSRRSRATRALPRHLINGLQNYARYGSRQAASLAYFAIFSVFPLALLIAVVVGNILGPAVAQEQIVNGLRLFLPESTVVDIQEVLTGVLNQSTSFGLIALVAILWAATSLFSNVTMALDFIFEVPSPRSLWRLRLVAIILSLFLIILVFASFITSGVLRLFAALSPGNPGTWVSIGGLFLPLGLNVVIFAMLFRYIPSREVAWDAVWPAALFGAIGWELAKSGFEWYLTSLANYSVVYGSIATGIVLLFWAYLLASIFLFSAELCARLNEWLSEQHEWESARQTQQSIKAYFQNSHFYVPPPEIYNGQHMPQTITPQSSSVRVVEQADSEPAEVKQIPAYYSEVAGSDSTKAQPDPVEPD